MPTYRQMRTQRDEHEQVELPSESSPSDQPHLLHRRTSKRIENLSKPLERRVRQKVPPHHSKSAFGGSVEENGSRGRRTVISNEGDGRYRPLFRYNTPDPPIKRDSKLKHKKMMNRKKRKSSLETQEIEELYDDMLKDVGDVETMESSQKTTTTSTALTSLMSSPKSLNFHDPPKLAKKRRLSTPKLAFNVKDVTFFKRSNSVSSVSSTSSRKEFAESAKLKKLHQIIQKEKKEKEGLIKIIGAGIVGMTLLALSSVMEFQILECLEMYLTVTGVVRTQSWWEFKTYSVYELLQFPETASQVVAFISGIVVPIGCGVVFLSRALYSLYRS